MGAEQTIAAFDCHPTGSFPDGTRGRQLSSKSGRSVRSRTMSLSRHEETVPGSRVIRRRSYQRRIRCTSQDLI